MNKIKITGLVTLLLTLGLIVVFELVHHENEIYDNKIESLSRQKDFTQEIAKQIFYSYQNKKGFTKELNSLMKEFISQTNQSMHTRSIDKQTIELWNNFYLEVQKYKDLSKINSPYSSTLVNQIVKNIYDINLKLTIHIQNMIDKQTSKDQQSVETLKIIEHTMFAILIITLVILFFQLKDMIEFLQNFIRRSKKILETSSIKELRTIDISQKDSDSKEANQNFNSIVLNIQQNIDIYSKNLDTTYTSMNTLEQNIEELFNFLHSLNNSPRDESLTQKEDLVIHSLDELMVCNKKLQNLKQDLNNLINQKN